MKNNLKIWVSLWMLMMCVNTLSATSQQYEKQLATASYKAFTLMQKGPTKVNLGSLAELTLPKEYGFLPAKEVKEMLSVLGNDTSGVMGAISSNPDVNSDSKWLVLLSYKDSGHILDDDALDWDSEALLTRLKEGTEASNKIRRERGLKELHVLGWIKPLNCP